MRASVVSSLALARGKETRASDVADRDAKRQIERALKSRRRAAD